jgi:predicted MFS family arabinose efflux permease
MSAQNTVSEGRLLFLIGAVQFVNVLDFMMVMPLGPDFAKALDMPVSSIGLVGGSYTAAAAISGLAGASFLDRFDRRQALAATLTGLVLATAAGGLALNLNMLLAARIAAGCFGGPATALCLAIIGDAIPVQRRGRAMGAFMGSFSLASVLGVPSGLKLAELSDWRLPFFAVAGLGLLIVPLAFMFLPPLRLHLERTGHDSQAAAPRLSAMLRPSVLLSLAAISCAMVSSFALMPNIATWVQFNLGYPREQLPWLYLVGGILSFVTMRVAGGLTDRHGAAWVATGGVALFIVNTYFAFIEPSHAIPILPLFAGFMVTSSFRVVPMQALSSRVPQPHERARFMSLQSAVQHMAGAVGAVISSQLLSSDAHGALVGMETLAWLAIGVTTLVPFVLFALQARVTASSALHAQAV